MGAILANALLALTTFQWVAIVLLIVVIIAWRVWKAKQQ
jgi:hypothetical protein